MGAISQRFQTCLQLGCHIFEPVQRVKKMIRNYIFPIEYPRGVTKTNCSISFVQPPKPCFQHKTTGSIKIEMKIDNKIFISIAFFIAEIKRINSHAAKVEKRESRTVLEDLRLKCFEIFFYTS